MGSPSPATLENYLAAFVEALRWSLDPKNHAEAAAILVDKLKLPQDGRRRFAGVLQAVASEEIAVEVDGREYRLPLERIQKARLKPL